MIEETQTLENTIATAFESWLSEHYSSESKLKKVKSESIRQFTETGLPGKKSEAYKYTPVTRILEKNFDFEKRSDNTSWTEEACQTHFYDVEEANHLVFINGHFTEEFSKTKSTSSELEIRMLGENSYENLSEARTYLGKIGDQSQDPFAAWNLARFNQGLFIKCAKNSDNIPTFLYHFLDAENSQEVVYPRILVVAEPGSRLNIYEKSFVKGEFNTFSNSLFEAEVKENAEVRYTKIQNYLTTSFSVEGIYANQHKDSRFYTNTYSFKGAMVRNNIYIGIDAGNCEAHMYGLYLLGGKSHFDNNTSVDHLKPHSFSNELYKGILDEDSKGVFNGKIYVRPEAQKTNAFQSNNNILLSDSATVNTKPQLEIWADDVKCSHGCTTGQLDEEAIFYLRSRGIEKNKAKALMLNAFANETLQEVKHEAVKAEIESLILNKL